MTAQPTWLHPGHDPLAEDLSLDPVEQAIRDIAAGRPVVVVDDEDRENEGDLVIAAEKATPEIVAFMMSECRGLICAPMESDELERLDLPQMVQHNTESMQTAFTVSVDASAAHGVTTGISAADRATTLRMLAGGVAGPGDFVRPGHIFPLRARSGGVLVRNGHTEAAVDLARLAGLRPAGAIVEIAGEDGVMLRLPELVPFARKHGLTIISIEDLIAYRRGNEPTVRREAETRLPTAFGDFTAYGYRSTVDGVEHVALVHGEIGDGEDILVRIHSECLTGDIFQSQRCDCGPQLHASMRRITEEGRGVVVYLRGHEGRGIGLLSKLRAYELQERGDDPKVQQFLRRLQGVLVARSYVMMDYDCRVEHLERAVALTPGLESPTISPLHHEGWVAVRSMVAAKEAQRIMDDLYELGARAILTTAIHACRL
ncbi:3,4-dihydroxy-2-butanone-4-phosphate synthase [Streptomyces griseus]